MLRQVMKARYENKRDKPSLFNVLIGVWYYEVELVLFSSQSRSAQRRNETSNNEDNNDNDKDSDKDNPSKTLTRLYIEHSM